MISFLIANWLIPAVTFVVCGLYVCWKAKGGSLLFKIDKKDDGATQVMKAVFGLGWAFGSMLVAIWVFIFSAIWLLIAGLGALLGAG